MSTEEISAARNRILPEKRSFLGVRPDLARDLSRRSWLGVKDAAAVLEVSERTVYRHIKAAKQASRRRPCPSGIPTAPGFGRHRIPTAYLLGVLDSQAGRADA